MRAMYTGLAIASVVMLGLVLVWNLQSEIPAQDATGHALSDFSLWICAVAGAIVTAVMMWVTDFYTGDGSRFVARIADASKGGHATNIISGLAVGMQSTVIPVAVIVAAIVLCYDLAGLFGVGVAAMSMLSLAGIVVAIDAYGPITDNAGGIAEMAELGAEVRRVTIRWTPSGTPQRRSRGLRDRVRGPRGGGAVRHTADLRHLRLDSGVPLVLAGLFAGASPSLRVARDEAVGRGREGGGRGAPAVRRSRASWRTASPTALRAS
jgi:K(+)-stimulated pyrophosphate-energized sodium pump